ncbi:membrane protease subunit, stomatin/prohibitin [Nostoc sp. PCC 7524]|jgi:regulator of protease activity HflC (stomatin/prohibitin superfamily)|uniref:SPFH domain-containing protein n=1 Tax=Nostoc sp. (strain ATCC 29411 / PCC 7524) TaxID=28072 RepID=UPI00029EDC2F|nr:SPFH domain-containing protein [Nostoc sp. PCC 7524]AFY50865.1 membrane protease subunit, stomatin/prohibitin [Nostoc sp. PCC 7524]
MEPIIAIVLALTGYALASTKIINEGNAALVERLGRKHRTLKPGLNFIVPLVDQVVMEDTTREQFIDIKPQNVITKDNIYLEVDAVLFWRIKDVEKSFYAIEDLQGSLSQLATTTLREIIAQNTVEETNVSRAEMDKAILDQLNHITADWGVEITRLDIQRITPPESVRKSMEEERAAEIKKRALITEAEAERQAAIKKAEGTMTSMQIIAEGLRGNPENREILRYLVAQDYINASYRLGESPNAKVVFVDPGKTGELVKEVIADTATTEVNGSNGEHG